MIGSFEKEPFYYANPGVTFYRHPVDEYFMNEVRICSAFTSMYVNSYMYSCGMHVYIMKDMKTYCKVYLQPWKIHLWGGYGQ